MNDEADDEREELEANLTRWGRFKRSMLWLLNCGSPEEDEDDHADGSGTWFSINKWDLIRVCAVGIAVILSLTRVWHYFLPFDIFSLIAVVIGGYPIYKEALEDGVLELKMTMELSMSIALFAAMAIKEFQTAVLIVFFVLIAEILEHLTVGQGRKALRLITDVLPNEVTLINADGVSHRQVRLSEVQVGDSVLVKPGARIPSDGKVLTGTSFVNQASITGESLPVEKVPGSAVFAGTLNQHGALTIVTTSVGRDTAFGKIIHAVERAEKSRAPIERLADQLSAYLVRQ